MPTYTACGVEFENQVLSIGREFLPEVARKVLNKQPLTEQERHEYEAFLKAQKET